MKLFFLCTAAGWMLTTSCNNDKQITHTRKNEDGTTTSTRIDVANYTEGADNMSKKMEELKKIKPLTLEELKALLPEEMVGLKRSHYNANTTLGFAMVEGEYKKDDTSAINMVIYDCAGEAGSGIYGMTYWAQMNVQTESEDGYTKTVDFMGGKAIESYQKGNNQTSLTYTNNGRLLVILTGRNIDNATVKEAARSIELKTL
jgi:hypothetical protein